MGDSLSYRVSETGELGFNEIVETARDWIKGNVNGQLKLTASISLKVTAVKDGESVQDIGCTTPLGLKESLREVLTPGNSLTIGDKTFTSDDLDPVIDTRGAKPGEVLHMSSACSHRHHSRCQHDRCFCACHTRQDA